MKKVVFVNQSSGYLAEDVINEYSKTWDEVAYITGREVKAFRPLNPKVTFSKCIRYNKSNFLTRIFTWAVSTVQITWLLRRKYKGYYVVFYTNPPMSYFATLWVDNPFSIVVYDLYPEALLNLKTRLISPIVRLWARMNRRIFARAAHIYTLSHGMKSLIAQYCEESKIKVTPCWAMDSSMHPVPKDENPFVKAHHLEGKFVIMYSGNIGYTHNVEKIVELAEALKEDHAFQFLIIGEGMKKKALQDLVAEKCLTNCRFLPYQPMGQLMYSLSSADLSVVTLTPETARVSVPSKTFNLLAVGSPLLVIAPRDSEINRIVEEYHCGASFESNQTNAMVNFILQMRQDKDFASQLSECSQRASQDFTYELAANYLPE